MGKGEFMEDALDELHPSNVLVVVPEVALWWRV
jgi:hypothetical protein